MATLNVLWRNVRGYGNMVRSEELDGLEYWEILKKVLEPYSMKIQWSATCLTFYNALITIGVIEEHDEKTMRQSEWERHHFLLQHGRIPFKNASNANLIKLLQIAYNDGQFKAEFDRGEYSEEHVVYYQDHWLGDLTTYIDDNCIKQISIPDELIDVVAKMC